VLNAAQVKRKLPKVNAALAARLMEETKRAKTSHAADVAADVALDGEGEVPLTKNQKAVLKRQKAAAAAASTLEDDRFKALFTDKAFTVDEESLEYQALRGGVGVGE